MSTIQRTRNARRVVRANRRGRTRDAVRRNRAIARGGRGG